ncbi:MAG TPA: hypothetical protein VLA93_04750 [Pyrinomonadaceae bacterium]|nr:hypothetical protein [Pyrinomonadaceae bacterium]
MCKGREQKSSQATLGITLLSVLCVLGMCQPHATATSIGPSLLLDPEVAQHAKTKPDATANARSSPDAEQLRRTIKRQAIEIEQLRRKVAELDRLTQLCSVRDRLTKEEQRAEGLQHQLIGVGEKEAPLQARLGEVNDQLRPEILDSLPISGSLRPEQVRETTRQRLTNEKTRLQTQLDLLQQTRTRLQSSLSITDVVIQTLRAQIVVR